MRRLVARLRGNTFERMLVAAAQRRGRQVLLYWSRSLGDTALGTNGGVLTMVYYHDVHCPLALVSLWVDPRQGVLRRKVASPHPRLRHVPLLGAGEAVSKITVEEVFGAIAAGLRGVQRP